MNAGLICRSLRAFALTLALLVPAVSWAANPLDPTAAEMALANAHTVGVISGGVDGTYIRIASDLSSVLDSGDQLRVLTVVGKGSLQNVSDVLYLRGIDIGLVQSDVLAYAKLNHLYPGLEKSLQYISKLYDEEVHILARSDVNAIEDLAGKKVNVDVRGSGTAMTSSVLFQGLGIAVDPTYDDQQTALDKLKNGEIAALVYVAGKPAKLFSGLSADNGLHFLSVPFAQSLADTYLQAELDHAAYPSLVTGKLVDTVAVGSVMAVFAWAPRTDRYARVSRFIDAFFSKFQQFLQPPPSEMARGEPGRPGSGMDPLRTRPGGAGPPTLDHHGEFGPAGRIQHLPLARQRLAHRPDRSPAGDALPEFPGVAATPTRSALAGPPGNVKGVPVCQPMIATLLLSSTLANFLV